jgi:serine/threonine protein kinase
MPPPSLHPTDQILHAYGLGKLDDYSVEGINAHLASCPECRGLLAAISGDTFLDRLRDAQGSRSASGGSSPGKFVPPPAAETLPPELVDNPDYEIVRELGRGGMGVVYLVRNRLMGRLEVLKVVGKHLVERPSVLDRFLREIRSAASLHHPNIVSAYSAMRLGQGVVLAMEYVDGDDLSKLVKTKGPLPVVNACYFAYQAALGLQHAYERGMVHRDIKPANLILAREGKRGIVKVLDFGLAKVTSEGQFDSGLTHEGQMLGTPDYIAPEQIVDAQKADIRADIYSLGCTLYYLLTGGPPFRGKSLYDLLQAHHSTDAQPLNLARPDVPAELAALVAKLMAKERHRRFQTPGEVAQALTPFFKPGAKQAGATVPTPVAVPAAEADPIAEATVPPPREVATPARRPTSKRSPEGVAWESLIEFEQTEPATLASNPKSLDLDRLPDESAGEPPRSRWPVIAGAAALGALALVIITITTNKGTTKITLPDNAAAKVERNDDIATEVSPKGGRMGGGMPGGSGMPGGDQPKGGSMGMGGMMGGRGIGGGTPESGPGMMGGGKSGPGLGQPKGATSTAKPPAPLDAKPTDIALSLALDIRHVPVRPGVLKVDAGLPGGSWPQLIPDDVQGWRVGDAGLVTAGAKGLVVDAGMAGNFLITRRADYRKSTIKIEMSASKGAEAFLVLRAAEGPDGWGAVTSRIVEEGGKIRAGLQSVDFALPERGAGGKVDEGRVEYLPNANFRLQFSIDAKDYASVVARGKAVTVRHDGPRKVGDTPGAVGLFVRKGSVTVWSLMVEE